MSPSGMMIVPEQRRSGRDSRKISWLAWRETVVFLLPFYLEVSSLEHGAHS